LQELNPEGIEIIQPGVDAMQSRLRRVANHKIKTTLKGLHGVRLADGCAAF
jgi:hypothetical protein